MVRLGPENSSSVQRAFSVEKRKESLNEKTGAINRLLQA